MKTKRKPAASRPRLDRATVDRVARAISDGLHGDDWSYCDCGCGEEAKWHARARKAIRAYVASGKAGE